MIIVVCLVVGRVVKIAAERLSRRSLQRTRGRHNAAAINQKPWVRLRLLVLAPCEVLK